MDRRVFMLSSASLGALMLGPRWAKASDVRPAVVRRRDERGVVAQLVLLPTHNLILGRGRGSDVLLKASPLDAATEATAKDTWISRRHLRVTFSNVGAKVEDLGSTNGTYLGRRRLEPGREVFVPDGGKLKIGESVTLRLSVIRDGKTPRGVVVHKLGDSVRYALVSGTVGLSPTAADIVTSLPGAGAAISLQDRGASHLRVRAFDDQLAVGQHPVTPGEWFEIVRPQSLRLAGRTLELASLEVDELRHIAGPSASDRTYVGPAR